ncbi:MAG: hypothetical protein J5802_01455 [Butyrivibrio sp.]|nr:hypothetical protein [Butyrivibrio sp.]
MSIETVERMGKPKFHIDDILEYIIIFAVIISSSSIWVQEDAYMLDGSIVKLFIVGLCMVWLLISRKSLDLILSRYDVAAFLVIILAVFLYTVTHMGWIIEAYLNAFIPTVVFSVMFMVSRRNGRADAMATKFVNVMTIMGLESLIFYFLINYTQLLTPTGYIKIKWSWLKFVPSYYNIYYDPMPGRLYRHGFTRNCAIFPEAPMFCYLLCLAIMINELCIIKRSRIKSAILFIAIFSTVSTTGYYFLILLYVYKYISSNWHRMKLTKLMLIPAILFAAYSYVIESWNKKMGTSSFSVRRDHVFACIKCFFNTNGIGCGIGNADYVLKFMTRKNGISCGLPYIFAQGGVFWGFMFVIPILITIFVMIKKKKFNNMFACVLLTFILFLTACHNKYDTWFVFAFVVFANDKFIEGDKKIAVRIK